MTCLYRQVLGEAFETLPPLLRRFHDTPGGGCARGVVSITRGEGRLRNAIASGARLLEPGTAVPIRLRVTVEGEQERWTRDFGSRRLETVQWTCHGLLIEAYGALRFGFRLSIAGEEMRFETARCWLLSMPLPRALAPRVGAVVIAGTESWYLRVRVEAPVLGLLVAYEGEVTPE